MADMIHIDYEQLNEAAQFLYDHAHNKGLREGEEQGRNASSVYHSLDKLKYVRMLANLAEECGTPPGNDTQRRLLNIIRNILGGVSHFDAEAEIHAARDACGATGFQADFTKLIESAEAAETKLSKHNGTP